MFAIQACLPSANPNTSNAIALRFPSWRGPSPTHMYARRVSIVCSEKNNIAESLAELIRRILGASAKRSQLFLGELPGRPRLNRSVRHDIKFSVFWSCWKYHLDRIAMAVEQVNERRVLSKGAVRPQRSARTVFDANFPCVFERLLRVHGKRPVALRIAPHCGHRWLICSS